MHDLHYNGSLRVVESLVSVSSCKESHSSSVREPQYVDEDWIYMAQLAVLKNISSLDDATSLLSSNGKIAGVISRIETAH